MSDFGSLSSPVPRSPTSRKIWANRFRGADSGDLARVYRFDLDLAHHSDVARGARRSGCLVFGIGEATGSILNRGWKGFCFCCCCCGRVGRVCAENKFAYATWCSGCVPAPAWLSDADEPLDPGSSCDYRHVLHRSSATPNPMVSFPLQDISLKETFILFD